MCFSVFQSLWEEAGEICLSNKLQVMLLLLVQRTHFEIHCFWIYLSFNKPSEKVCVWLIYCIDPISEFWVLLNKFCFLNHRILVTGYSKLRGTLTKILVLSFKYPMLLILLKLFHIFLFLWSDLIFLVASQNAMFSHTSKFEWRKKSVVSMWGASVGIFACRNM